MIAAQFSLEFDHQAERLLAARGYDVVEAKLPAVVSVTAGVVEPRYPTFKGIMDAKKKPVETKSLEDLGVVWDEPYHTVLDESEGFPWARWFVGGKTNICHNCVDRQVAQGHGDEVAVGLFDRARESVEDVPAGRRVGRRQSLADEADHDVVADEPAGVHDLLGNRPGDRMVVRHSNNQALLAFEHLHAEPSPQ